MNEKEAAALFKVLSDANRLRIARHLAASDDICACRVLDELDITQPTLSHHMKVLCTCGLVSCRKEGKWMHYSLNRKAWASLGTYLEVFASSDE